MIREERNAGFWEAIALANPHLPPVELAPLINHPACTPLASEHGGYLFCRLDGLGRVFELHALYLTDGRGKEAHGALHAALGHVSPEVLLATETEHPMSRPPRSFGFRVAGKFAPSPFGPCRTWVLTRNAYHASPAYRRL